VRVIVADDSFLRELLVRTFPTHHVQVLGEARTTDELLRLVDADPPDIVIVDLAMPRLDPNADPEYDAGLEAAKEIRRLHPDVAILALSQYAEVSWAEDILSLGMAVGYQLKKRVHDMKLLVDVMRSVVAGDVRIDSTLVGAAFARKRRHDSLENLSAREREVLRLMAEGLSNLAISERLFIRESTVEGHERSIYRTLGLSGLRAETDGRLRANLRVMAVLTFIRSTCGCTQGTAIQHDLPVRSH
jgi:DNA-binding NarL/FixJ family response regulator